MKPLSLLIFLSLVFGTKADDYDLDEAEVFEDRVSYKPTLIEDRLSYEPTLIANRVYEPGVYKANDTYYMVTTNVGGIENTRIHSSKDLVSWKFETELKREDISNWKSMREDSRIHSPEVHQFGGQFNFYYDAYEPINNDRKCKSIGVTTSDSPTGPFQDIGRPLISICPGVWTLNPHVAHDGKFFK